MSNSWVDDVTGSTDDDSDTRSLFEENLERMVEEGTLGSLNPQTVANNIGDVDDLALLSAAVDAAEEIDNDAARERISDLIRERVGELNREQQAEAEDAESGNGQEPVADDDVPDSTSESETTGSPSGDESEPANATTADGSESDDTAAEVADGGVEPKSGPSSEMPEVDLSHLAPGATPRSEAASEQNPSTLLVWGREGTGKSHIAHSAPKPIAYIDTEGKASELAEKFADPIYYWTPESFAEARDALSEAFDVLSAYRDEGVTGTIVVDSMTVMWEWAQLHHMLQTQPSASSVAEARENFEASFGDGNGDWQTIKGYHNTQFRDRILDSPYNVVLTSGEKMDYSLEDGNMDKSPTDDGEKHNRYAVKDVVRLHSNADGRTEADLLKAAKTRYSFVGLEWPTWDLIYQAIGEISEAEQADAEVDVSQWDYGVIDGQPVTDPSDGDSDD